MKKENKTIMTSIRLTQTQYLFLKERYGSVQKAINQIVEKKLDNEGIVYIKSNQELLQDWKSLCDYIESTGNEIPDSLIGFNNYLKSRGFLPDDIEKIFNDIDQENL